MSATPPSAGSPAEFARKSPQSSETDDSNSIVLNGVPRRVAAGHSVASLLDELELAGRRVAVAINGYVVSRSAYCHERVSEGDRIEILEAVGGG